MMRGNKRIDIKGALALAGAFHFLCCCGRACALPFLTLYFRQLGLSPAMTGVVMGTKHLVSLLWRPLATLLSKHYDRRRLAITGSLVCSVAAALALVLIPSASVEMEAGRCNASDPGAAAVSGLGPALLVPTLPTHSVSRSNDISTVGDATKPPPPVLTSASSLPSTPRQEVLVDETSHPQLSQTIAPDAVNDSAGEPTVYPLDVPSSAEARRPGRSLVKAEAGERQQRKAEDEARLQFLGSLKVMDVQHQLFFLLLIVVSLWEALSAPLEWTADDGLYEYLDFVDATDRYGGSTRVWGLLGGACGVGGAGLLVSHLSCRLGGGGGGGGIPRSAVHFFCYAGLMALAVPLAARLPLYLNKKQDRANGLLKAARLVRGNPRALLCAVTTFLVGAAGSAVENFLLWQMQDHGSGELHAGASLALGLLSQAAFPLLAGRLSKVLSPGRVLVLAAASLALQCLYYSFLWAPWAALPAQLLSCLSGGALWWAVRAQCQDVATPGAERSVRRVYRGLTLDLGLGLGSFSGGFVVQRFGAAWLFRGTAVGLALWCLCLALLQWKAPRQRRVNYSRLLAADARSEASDSESEQERDWLDKALEDDDRRNNNGGRMNH